MPSKIAIKLGKCWWCQERDADSREHKFKRSDLVREHGRGELRDSRTLVAYRGANQSEHRSTKNDALKFSPSLCAYCNNTRSQPFDQSYDRFIEWVFGNEERVLADRSLDLEGPLSSEWSKTGEDVLRYFVKHICCRLAESLTHEGDILLPGDALAFLDGGPPPESITSEMWIEPTWLRFAQAGQGDPLWVKIMGMEPVHPGPEMRLGSRWNYGWLVLGWECWGEEDGNVFLAKTLDLPIVATRSVGLELGFMPTTAGPPSDDGLDQSWLDRVAGGSVIDADALSRSAVAQKFIGGALDFEAGLREQAPDRRELLLAEPLAAIEIEVMRTGLLCGIARRVWSKASVDVAAVRSVALTEFLLEPDVILAEVEELRRTTPEQGWLAVSGGLAAMASLKLVEANELGVDSDEGFDAMLLAASLAGASAAVAGASGEDWPPAWDSVNAAAARIARVG